MTARPLPDDNVDPVDQRILDAASRLLARFGYSKTTIDDIAREAGIGKGSVYLHFRSKEAIALAIIDRMVVEVTDALRAIAGHTDISPDVRLRQMLVARVMTRFDVLQPFGEGLHDFLSAIRPAMLAQREKHLNAEEAILCRVIGLGVKGGSLHASDAKAAGRALLDATNSFLPYYLSPRQMGSRTSVERRASRVAELLLRGLSRR